MEILHNVFTKSEIKAKLLGLAALFWKLEDNIKLPKSIDDYFKDFKENLYVFVEFPYVDKVYRDSYYMHFSKKHYHYERDCIRLSLFETKIQDSDFEYHNISSLQEKFRGFVVVRPTYPKIFGRAVIDPRVLKNNNFEICPLEIEVMINGVKLIVNGFPHSSQDGETIRCAETSIWSIMEYFGNKYPEYSTVLPSKIVSILRDQMYHRQTPSTGLTPIQISYALKELGFGTKLYTKKDADSLRKIFHIYIESGIPVIAHIQIAQMQEGVTEKGEVNHSVVYIGKKHKKNGKTTEERNLIKEFRNIKIYDSCNRSIEYVGIDDNLPPYQSTTFNSPLSYLGDYGIGAAIKNIIVPLHKSIHLEAFQAMDFVLSILEDGIIGWKNMFSNELNIRLFLASSRSFKSKHFKDNSLDAELKSLIINQTMPKFVWVAEIATPTTPINKACGMIIIDATAYNLMPKESFINIIYPERIVFKDEEQIEKETKPFNIYTNLQRRF